MPAATAPSYATVKTFDKMMVHFHVLSPIHIGTREGALLPMEFLYDGEQVHVVDESKLGRFLMQRNLMDAFVQQAFSGDLRKKGLAGFLRERARDVNFKTIGPMVAASSVPGGSADMPDFRPFVRDGFGNLYIPGTSIKGVLRTAFLYAMLKNENPTGKSPHPRETSVHSWIRHLRSQPNKERAKKFLSASLQKDLLQSWQIPGNAHDQNKDILRCLKVRDSYPAGGTVQTRVIPIRFLSKKPDGGHYWSHKPRGSGDLVIWVEAVVRGTFETEILWDQELWEKFRKENPRKTSPATSVKQVLLLVDRMNRDVVAHEKAFLTGRGIPEGAALKSWYEALGTSLLRIGFGSGMLSTTVNLLWSEKLRQDIRNECGQPRGSDPAPKSRRVWVKSDKECLPMGWARIMIPTQGEANQNAQRPTSQPKVAPGAPAGETKTPRSTGSQEATPTPRPGETAPTAAPKTPAASHREKIQPPQPAPKPSSQPTPPPSSFGEATAPQTAEASLVSKAKTVDLTKKIAMERLLEELEAADTATAKKAAQVLKDRMIKQNLWKKSPYRTSVEEILSS